MPMDAVCMTMTLQLKLPSYATRRRTISLTSLKGETVAAQKEFLSSGLKLQIPALYHQQLRKAREGSLSCSGGNG